MFNVQTAEADWKREAEKRDVVAWISNRPIKVADAELVLLAPAFVRHAYRHLEPWCAVLQLIIYETRGNERVVRDIKEQQVDFSAITTSDRFEAIMEGWALGVEYVMRASEQLETLVPDDFTIKRDVAQLVQATTGQDYFQAFTAKKRFGRLL